MPHQVYRYLVAVNKHERSLPIQIVCLEALYKYFKACLIAAPFDKLLQFFLTDYLNISCMTF